MAPFGAAPGWEQAEDCPEDLSFQSFTQHATLFLPRFNTDFVFSVFSWTGGQKPNRLVPECLAANATRGPDRGGGNLESGILSNRHRDVAQAGKPGGRVRAAGRSTRNGAMRPRRTIFAAFAPIAGAAAAARAERVPPPLPSDVHPGLQPAPTTGAAGVLWLDASQPLPVDQTAIDNIIMLRRARWGPRWRRRKDRLPRPASLGETVAIRPFSP